VATGGVLVEACFWQIASVVMGLEESLEPLGCEGANHPYKSDSTVQSQPGFLSPNYHEDRNSEFYAGILFLLLQNSSLVS